MSLAEMQSALARLYTDAAARRDFACDPLAAARAAGLEGDAAEALAALGAPQISRYANSLLAKRRQDVEAWLPLTAQALGSDFAPVLRETFAEPPPGARADALALVARLKRAPTPSWIGALASYEAEFLRAWGPRGRLVIRLYASAAPRIAAALAAGETPVKAERALTVAIWLRLPGGRLRHRWWAIGGPR